MFNVQSVLKQRDKSIGINITYLRPQLAEQSSEIQYTANSRLEKSIIVPLFCFFFFCRAIFSRRFDFSFSRQCHEKLVRAFSVYCGVSVHLESLDSTQGARVALVHTAIKHRNPTLFPVFPASNFV